LDKDSVLLADTVIRLLLAIIVAILSGVGVYIARANKRIAESNREIAKVNFALLIQRARVDFQHKSMDMLSTCDKIYAQLRETEKEITLATESKLKKYDTDILWTVYWLPFWELQLTQFEFYTLGYIPVGKFALWMSYRKNDWLQDRKLGDMTYKDAFEKALDLYPSSAKLAQALLAIIGDIHKNSSDGVAAIVQHHCNLHGIHEAEYFHNKLAHYADKVVNSITDEYSGDMIAFDAGLVLKNGQRQKS
jgi:hypothetical protein